VFTIFLSAARADDVTGGPLRVSGLR